MIIKSFAIDFIREIIYRELELKHLEDDTYIGGENDISLFSFYEQLKNQDQVNRYVERFRDLTEQANRSSLIANGVILAPENPTITNLYSSLIMPLTFQTTFRTTLEDRDLVVKAMHYLFDKLKGKSVNVAELDDGSLFYLRKMGNNKEPMSVVGSQMLPENGMWTGVDTIENSFARETIIKEKTYTTFNDLVANVYYSLGTCSNIKTKLSQLTPNGNNDMIYVVGAENESDYEIKLVANDNNIIKQQVCRTLHFKAGTLEIEWLDDENQTQTWSTSWDQLISYGSTLFINIKVKEYQTSYNINELAKLVVGFSYFLDEISKVIYNVFFQELQETYFKDLFPDFVYYRYRGHIKAAVKDTENSGTSTYYYKVYDTTESDLVIPLPETGLYIDSMYKVSISFDSERVETPITLNEKETCVVSFGGSATLVDKDTKLGNDLVQISISKKKIVKSTDFVYSNNKYYLEPLELPSGNNIGTEMNQLLSNKFINNSHASSLSPSLQYTFVCSDKIKLLQELYDYARYGINGVDNDMVSPNTIYEITETWSANGVVSTKTFLGKIVESIDIENNENDVLTITIPIQIQGENN